MPIRAPRGRATAYRGIWQWPLRSPARLAGTVVVLLVLAVVGTTALTLVQGGGGPAAAPAGGSSTVAAPGSSTTLTVAPTPRSLPPVPSGAPTTQPLSSAPAAALEVAREWTTAWLRPAEGTTTAEWLAGLEPYTTEAYLGVLATVDPSSNPATELQGIPRPVEVTGESVQVEVGTDAAALLVLVVRTDDGWLVSGHEQAG